MILLLPGYEFLLVFSRCKPKKLSHAPTQNKTTYSITSTEKINKKKTTDAKCEERKNVQGNMQKKMYNKSDEFLMFTLNVLCI